MSLIGLHQALQIIAPNGMAIALDVRFWKELVAHQIERAIQTQKLVDVETPLDHILADVDIDSSNTTIVVSSPKKVAVQGVSVKFRLKVTGVAKGCLSEHNILFNNIVGTVGMKDGSITLSQGNTEYSVQPPDTTNQFR